MGASGSKPARPDPADYHRKPPLPPDSNGSTKPLALTPNLNKSLPSTPKAQSSHIPRNKLNTRN